jgi:hypothetical protein
MTRRSMGMLVISRGSRSVGKGLGLFEGHWWSFVWRSTVGWIY